MVKLRVVAPIAVGLAILAVVWIAWQREPSESLSSAPSGDASPATANRPSASPPALGVSQLAPVVIAPPSQHQPTSIPPAFVLPSSPSTEIARAAQDLEKISRMLRDYRTSMGDNPVGTNAEIMKAVMGKNPKKARLGPPEGMTLNENGELVDPWGHAFFFHQLSGTQMEVRSAGPDGKMWTGDDIVRK